MIDLPEVVRNKAVAVGAAAWIDRLPELVASIAHEWGLEIGRTFPDSTEAYVTAVTMTDGTPAVLKFIVPRDRDAAVHEITVLRLADGNGCVRMLRCDESRQALLLERLGPSMHDLRMPLDARLVALTTTAARLWTPAPDSGLPSGADKARWLADAIEGGWARLDRPCSRAAVDHALVCAERRGRAHDAERAVLVHGDVHEWNALQADDGFKLVDPDGMLAEPEYDLGILMREDPLELMVAEPFERARRLAALSSLDATAIWEWGVVERVSTGLLCTEVGLQPSGRHMLAAADHIAALTM